MASGLSLAWFYSQRIVTEIDAYILRKEGRGVRVRYKPIDMFRLLKLRTWSIRHYVSVAEVLDLVVPILKAQMTGRRATTGLGIGVRALTGGGAYRVLVDELQKRYPNNEQVTAWKQQERIRHLELEKREDMDGLSPKQPKLSISPLEHETLDDYVTEYRKRVISHRVTNRAAATSKRRRQKPYRWNPWL